MRARRRIRTTRTEEGIALLISIFILLLISVVAIALIVSSGTESALAGNYRSATGVYYAALAGLEEARGRLLAKNPNSFKNTTPLSFMPSPLPMGNPVYIINPAGGETVAPWDQSSKYPDTEYRTEFGGADPPNPSPGANSISGVGGVQGPLYKWVRINAVSEQSLGLDVDGNGVDPSLIYYDYTNSKLTTAPASSQVLEITSFAVLPNGSQKILQYLVALVPVKFPDFPSGQLSFPAALTLSGSTGNGAAFHAPASNSSYAVKGDDYDCSNPPVPTLVNPHVAIGVFTDTDKTSVINGIPSSPLSVRNSYTGLNPAPDVENISSIFPASLQTPSKLDALAQSIAQNADVIIPSGPITYPLPNVTGSPLTPLGMTSTNPLTVVVNGNLDISSWSHDGYGLLLVIGKFTYDPDTTWNGIILVIGQGKVDGSHTQYKQINGAMFVAQTRDSAGNLLPDPNLGGASVVYTDSMQGAGIRYASCWIQKAQPTGSYKILSFHEISQ